MTRLTISNIVGANLAADPRLMAETMGRDVRNVKPGRGTMRPWMAPATVATVPASPQRQTIYRMGRDTADESAYWLSWSAVVDTMRAFNPTDTTERTIYTGDGAPKWTDNTIALATAPYPTASRLLGVPAPETAITVSIHTDGGDGTEETVFVTCTFVNSLGEEGAPGPVSASLTVKPGAILNVSDLPAAPTGYGLTHRRIYCTKVGESTTDFYFAKQVTTATSSTTINTGELNDVMATADFDMPPEDGHSLTEMWNQMAAMISGKAVRCCEAGYIYAWPAAYEMPMGDTPVALGVFDQNLLVLTTGRPYVITGQSPDALSSSPIALDQACVAKAGVVSFGFAVVWPSQDGLFAMSSDGPKNLLAGVMTPEDWRAKVPETMKASRHEGLYFAAFADGTGMIVDPAGGGVIFLDAGFDAAYRDSLMDALFVLNGANVQRWDAGTTPMTAKFVSKTYRQQTANCFTCGQVIANDYTGMVVRVYADGVLRYTKTVTNGKAFRLPRGFQALEWRVEVDTQGEWVAVSLAEHMAELDS